MSIVRALPQRSFRTFVSRNFVRAFCTRENCFSNFDTMFSLIILNCCIDTIAQGAGANANANEWINCNQHVLNQGAKTVCVWCTLLCENVLKRSLLLKWKWIHRQFLDLSIDRALLLGIFRCYLGCAVVHTYINPLPWRNVAEVLQIK